MTQLPCFESFQLQTMAPVKAFLKLREFSKCL